MKRFLLLLLLAMFGYSFSQTNKITLSNHSNANIYFYLTASNTSNWVEDCIDVAKSTKITILQPQSEVEYTNINNALSSNPSINDWNVMDISTTYSVDLSVGQQVSNGVTSNTQWSVIRFYIEDPTINPNAIAYELGPNCSINPSPANFFVTLPAISTSAEWQDDNGNVIVLIN